eukprot:6202842-Pleurochrysis_carterae.AAC.1
MRSSYAVRSACARATTQSRVQTERSEAGAGTNRSRTRRTRAVTLRSFSASNRLRAASIDEQDVHADCNHPA